MTAPQERLVDPSGDLLYVPNFITHEEEADFLKHLYSPSSAAPGARWVQLKYRRLMNVGGTVDPKGMFPEKIPAWVMEPIGRRIASVMPPQRGESGVLQPTQDNDEADAAPGYHQQTLFNQTTKTENINHILINEYLRPSGIMPHEDGPAYTPIVAIVSFESPLVIRFTKKEHDDTMGEATTSDRINEEGDVSVVLMPRSLVVFTGQYYTSYLHGIQDAAVEVVDPAKCLNTMSCLEQQAADKSSQDHEKNVHGCVSIIGDIDAARQKLQLSQHKKEEQEGHTCPELCSVEDGWLLVERGERRISATYRHVLKVAKFSASALFGK